MFRKLKDKLKGDDQSSGHHTQASSSQHAPQYPTNTSYPPQPLQQHDLNTGDKYQPPSGPPPGHSTSNTHYAPSPGAPPSQYPQQPPPSWDPPPYHNWTIIPDTSQLPPPPSIGYETSPTANATAAEGERAYDWTRAHPLWPPQALNPPTYQAIQNAQVALLKPPTYIGDLIPQPQAGHWRCRTYASCSDASLLTNLPLYSALLDSPLHTHRAKTIYFELRVLAIRNDSSQGSEAPGGIAIGFVAPPYPTFRLPGWQRGSLAVHGDDGRKYVNDTWGGVDFTTAFQPGETVGIGMTFAPPKNPPGYEQPLQQPGKFMDIDVFFTRNGRREGGWDGNEELDERSEGGSEGLKGECDLFAAIGVFGGVHFEVCFHPAQWRYRPF